MASGTLGIADLQSCALKQNAAVQKMFLPSPWSENFGNPVFSTVLLPKSLRRSLSSAAGLHHGAAGRHAMCCRIATLPILKARLTTQCATSIVPLERDASHHVVTVPMRAQSCLPMSCPLERYRAMRRNSGLHSLVAWTPRRQPLTHKSVHRPSNQHMVGMRLRYQPWPETAAAASPSGLNGMRRLLSLPLQLDGPRATTKSWVGAFFAIHFALEAERRRQPVNLYPEACTLAGGLRLALGWAATRSHAGRRKADFTAHRNLCKDSVIVARSCCGNGHQRD